MSADPAPRPEPPGGQPTRPPSVRVAIGLVAVLAVLLLLYVALTVLGRDGLLRALQDAGLSRAEARQFLVVNTTAPLVLGLLYGASAVGLSRGRAWGRWAGLVAALVLAVLVLSTMLTAGGLTVVSLLLLVLSVAAAASLLARTTREWLSPTGG
ncbi:hypothetical protein [Blastococcus sp. TF02-8]|uniref:hypothetical protein n=1 Tax=Blastococcus sp. TF02-8 TaxID=2250574 RepID=UPI0011BD74AB|nr:hypothetical protein [Blastococcus sp. TF02-8]